MWSKINSYIKRYNLLKCNELYIVALSGGADSVALLLLLSEAGYKVHAAHCNFRLRGEESDRDELFCESLCKRLDVPLHHAHFDTREFAEIHKVSIEMAARELRYGWLARLCKDIGAAGVCVAHHQNDSVETVILNLIRGTGLRGLTGIQPKSELRVACGEGSLEVAVLRPFLCVTRKQIEGYLAQRSQPYVTDSTNLQADVMRNKIRLQVLPLLRNICPAVSDNIQLMTENLIEAQLALDGVLKHITGSNSLNLKGLDALGSREYFAFEWLKSYGFNGTQVRQILESATGSIITSTTGFDVLNDRGRLIVEPSLKPMKSVRIPEEGVYVLENTGMTVGTVVDVVRIKVRSCSPYVSKEPLVATLDAHKVSFPLTVRRVENGDWMIPFGMEGRRLLSDLMTDRKMSLFDKRKQLVVVDARGTIVWAVALRTDQRTCVTNTTSEVLELSVE
ncbi:MAG: tRNA lysidine(34) synthetase TilS [Prevotella sp.]|nr:tRNA lysidine(34) synthetase TilS [Prevotella sp.]